MEGTGRSVDLGSMPRHLRTAVRRGAKLAWWSMTLQLPTKLQKHRSVTSNSPLTGDLLHALAPPVIGKTADDPYQAWCIAYEPDARTLALQRRIAKRFGRSPTFSLLVPVFRTPVDVFNAMLNSVRAQSYEAWELCLTVVDTGSESAALFRSSP